MAQMDLIKMTVVTCPKTNMDTQNDGSEKGGLH